MPEFIGSDDALPQSDVRRWLVTAAAHDDQTMLREAHALGERKGRSKAVDDDVGEVRVHGRIVTHNLEPCLPVDEQHQFPAERGKGDHPWMRPKASLAAKTTS